MPSATAPRRAPRRLVQFLSVPAIAAAVVLGVWVTGGLITDDFRASVALTTVWLGMAAGLCLLIAVRSRTLRVPVLATYVVTAGLLGAFLASTTLRDRVVDEQVVTASLPRRTCGRCRCPLPPRDPEIAGSPAGVSPPASTRRAGPRRSSGAPTVARS